MSGLEILGVYAVVCSIFALIMTRSDPAKTHNERVADIINVVFAGVVLPAVVLDYVLWRVQGRIHARRNRNRNRPR